MRRGELLARGDRDSVGLVPVAVVEVIDHRDERQNRRAGAELGIYPGGRARAVHLERRRAPPFGVGVSLGAHDARHLPLAVKVDVASVRGETGPRLVRRERIGAQHKVAVLRVGVAVRHPFDAVRADPVAAKAREALVRLLLLR